jgi:hypothetical protein
MGLPAGTGARRLEQLAMLTLAEANQAIAAALARAQNMKMEIAVSVCDEGGRLVAFQRMDGGLIRKDLGFDRESESRGSYKKAQRRGSFY